MDEDFLSSDENDEEFKKMEKDIDDFLATIREDVTKTSKPQREASCSRVSNDYDCISSDDFEEKDFKLLNVKGHDLDFSSNNAGKSFDASSSRNNKRGWRPWKWKGHGAPKKRRGSQREQHNSGKRDQQKDCSNPWEEYEQYMKHLSNRKRKRNLKRSFRCRDDDECSWSPPRGRDEFDHEMNLSPRESSSYRRSVSPKQRYGYGKWRSSPDRRHSHQEERSHSKGTHRSKRTVYHRMYDEENYSSDSWSEKQVIDYDDRNRPGDQYWKHDDPFVENDDDFQGSLSETMDTVSVITACLERAIASNPGIAQKFSSACMFLLNKSVDRTCDDYEFEENSCDRFVDETGRVSSKRWRDSRSPSFSKSVGSSSGTSGSRPYKNRYEGDSKRIVVYHSSSSNEGDRSPDCRLQKVRYSPGRDEQRTTASTSQTISTNIRSSSKHHKNYEENPKRSVARSIRKIRKQCEEERNSTVRRALLALLEVHQRECDMYLRKPEAHPDYNKEYRAFVEKKSKSITDLGGDPNEFDFKQDWKRYWPTQINRVFKESWDAKMLKCASMLQKRGHVSKSLHTSSEKDATNLHPEKKQRTSKHGIEKKSEKVKSSEKPKRLQVASTEQCTVDKKEMDTELLSILRLLKHIKHKFKDCEVSFDIFYQRAVTLKEKKQDLCNILQGNRPLLEKIDASLKETLEDKNLTLIQKAIIQETHERFKCFLRNSKETSSHSKKNNENTQEENMKMVEVLCKEVPICKNSKITEKALENSVQEEGKNQIPSLVTDLHSPMVSCEQDMSYDSRGCCDNNSQIGRPVRTLTVVSIQEESSCTNEVQKITNDGSTSHSSLPSPKKQNGKFMYKSATTSIETDTDIQPPPPGVSPPPDGNLSSPDIIPPHSDVNSLTTDVIQVPCIASAPSPCVTSPATTVILSPAANVTSVAPTNIAPTTTITTPSHSTTSPGITQSSLNDKLPPPSSTLYVNTSSIAASADVPLSSPDIASSPGDRPAAIITKASLSDSSSHVPNALTSSDIASKAVQHSFTMSKPVEYNSKSIKVDTMTKSQMQITHHSNKNLLRSTIKDCFLSASSFDEESVGAPEAEGLGTLDNKSEESNISSVPNLPEDILKMFVVKPEDKNEIIENNKPSVNITNSLSNIEINPKPIEKKPIKITIPQFSKKKSLADFKPVVDDQELQ